MPLFMSFARSFFEKLPLRHIRLFNAAMMIMFVSVSLLPFQSVQAAKRVDLYTSSQVVLDQSESIRQQATASALAQVMIKVTGRAQVLSNPSVKQALNSASSYLLQYSYESTDETITIVGDERSASRLLMSFSESSIQQLLKSAQQPVWPDVRPEVLLWLASDQNGRRFVDKDTPSVRTVRSVATERGLPLVAPALDLTDRQQLSISRLWALDESAIRNASQRYEADAILAGRYSKVVQGSQVGQGNQVSGTTWRASFVLLHRGERIYLNATGTSEEQLSRKIIDQTANYLAGLEAVLVKDDGAAPLITMTVHNIVGFGDYAQVLAYINDIPLVVSTAVRRVEHNALVVDLAYNGNAQQLINALKSAERLQTNVLDEAIPVTATNTQQAIVYRWR